MYSPLTLLGLEDIGNIGSIGFYPWFTNLHHLHFDYCHSFLHRQVSDTCTPWFEINLTNFLSGILQSYCLSTLWLCKECLSVLLKIAIAKGLFPTWICCIVGIVFLPLPSFDILPFLAFDVVSALRLRDWQFESTEDHVKPRHSPSQGWVGELPKHNISQRHQHMPYPQHPLVWSQIVTQQIITKSLRSNSLFCSFGPSNKLFNSKWLSNILCKSCNLDMTLRVLQSSTLFKIWSITHQIHSCCPISWFFFSFQSAVKNYILDSPFGICAPWDILCHCSS